MTLEEAIKTEEQTAEHSIPFMGTYHRQIAKWLKELKQLKELKDEKTIRDRV